jgi:putative CocE/NonD family hydrolase
VTDYYPDWTEREQVMLQLTSAPFDRDTELTGHAVVSLRIATSEHDASVFAYLAEVDAHGRSRYITEGMLRMLHRHERPPPAHYAAAWPWRSFHRADARRMEPNVAETMRFALLPVSWNVMKGSRLRLSIAGTDADHFAQVPHGRPPTFELTVGGPDGCFVELPLR